MIPLDELKRLSREATPVKEWEIKVDETDCGRFEYATGPWHDVLKNNNDRAYDDAKLIVAMRNNIDAMIERMERLERVAEAVKKIDWSDVYHGNAGGWYTELTEAINNLELK